MINGRATKGAIIQIKDELSIRIYGLEPKSVFLDLLEFANRNSILTKKNKGLSDFRMK